MSFNASPGWIFFTSLGNEYFTRLHATSIQNSTLKPNPNFSMRLRPLNNEKNFLIRENNESSHVILQCEEFTTV